MRRRPAHALRGRLRRPSLRRARQLPASTVSVADRTSTRSRGRDEATQPHDCSGATAGPPAEAHSPRTCWRFTSVSSSRRTRRRQTRPTGITPLPIRRRRRSRRESTRPSPRPMRSATAHRPSVPSQSVASCLHLLHGGHFDTSQSTRPREERDSDHQSNHSGAVAGQ
jgi:hypothetical protein